MLIEAKDKVNAAERVLPDGALKNEFEEAMDAYTDAATAWGRRIEGKELYSNTDPGAVLIPKYRLTTRYVPGFYGDPGFKVAEPEGAVHVIWAQANSHLEEIVKLLGNKK